MPPMYGFKNFMITLIYARDLIIVLLEIWNYDSLINSYMEAWINVLFRNTDRMLDPL